MERCDTAGACVLRCSLHKHTTRRRRKSVDDENTTKQRLETMMMTSKQEIMKYNPSQKCLSVVCVCTKRKKATTKCLTAYLDHHNVRESIHFLKKTLTFILLLTAYFLFVFFPLFLLFRLVVVAAFFRFHNWAEPLWHGGRWTVIFLRARVSHISRLLVRFVYFCVRLCVHVPCSFSAR